MLILDVVVGGNLSNQLELQTNCVSIGLTSFDVQIILLS